MLDEFRCLWKWYSSILSDVCRCALFLQVPCFFRRPSWKRFSRLSGWKNPGVARLIFSWRARVHPDSRSYEPGSGSLTLGSFNVYHADSPTVSLSNGGDYDFSSGGWTQLGSFVTVPGAGDVVEVAATGVSARYIGVEIITDSNEGDARTVMEEFAVTAIPEPFTALLGGIGLLALLYRRR